MTEERRRFHRIQFDVPVRLHLDSGELETEVIDFSLKGALIKRRPQWDPIVGSEVTLECNLTPGQQEIIRMETEVCRIDDKSIGLSCKHIDVDSIMRLRRLVELNLGKPELLERDLEHLIDPNSDN